MSELQTINVVLLKKNRKYFACEINGYRAKLVINEHSDHLALGAHELTCVDRSIRSKYGVNIIYEIPATAEAGAPPYLLRSSSYNKTLTDACHALGGKWDAAEKLWVLPAIVADKAEELDEKFNSAPVVVEIVAKRLVDGGYREPLRFLGYTICRAYGRDSGARLGDGVSQVSGTIDSGGSSKNWLSCATKGATFRLSVPALVYADINDAETDSWEVRVVK